tara:strand:- start:507 stop:2090 length:1584 start_codon:yes stop_codon:yes gene_type:complete
MAEYFSKYRGRGGPAIEPGIIQMMGSIGDEYAKGIAKFGEEIGSAISERDERIRQENATEFFLNLGRTTGVEDNVSYNKANDERTQRVTAAEKRSAISYENLKAAHAQTGEQGDMGKANEIRDKIDAIQTKIGDIQSNVFRKDKAIDAQRKKLADPDRISVENYIPQSRLLTPKERKWADVWDRNPDAGMTSSSIKKQIKEFQKLRDELKDQVPKLQEDFILAKKFWQMESSNPGSSKGMNAPLGSDEYQTALERLNVFRELRDQTESRTRLQREALGPLAAQVDPLPVPSLADALPAMLYDKPDALARLMNYDRPTPKSALVESARNEVVAAELDLEKVLSEPELRREDFQRPETEVEKIRRLYVDKKKYPKDFGEKVITYLQKTSGPQLRIENLGEYGTWMVTNQGAQRVDQDSAKIPAREQQRIAQKTAHRKETKSNREYYDKEITRIESEISGINQKAADPYTYPEGVTAEDTRRKSELQQDLLEIKEWFRTTQAVLTQDIGEVIGGLDIGNPITETELIRIQ